MFKTACLVVLLFSVKVLAFEIPATLKAGDLIFLSLNCYACKLIEVTTHSPFSHVGIIDQDSQNGLTVIMAAEPQVSRVSVGWLVSKALSQPVFMRFNDPENRGTALRALDFARHYLGRPYDPDFVLGDDKLYCSELIYFSFDRATQNPMTPFRLKVMHFSPYISLWTQVLGHPPPEGQMGISPGDLADSPSFEKIL